MISFVVLISVPVKPKHSQMITLNTTTVTVWLDSWGDGGCGILYFVIEYREISHSQVNEDESVDTFLGTPLPSGLTRKFTRFTKN